MNISVRSCVRMMAGAHDQCANSLAALQTSPCARIVFMCTFCSFAGTRNKGWPAGTELGACELRLDSNDWSVWRRGTKELDEDVGATDTAHVGPGPHCGEGCILNEGKALQGGEQHAWDRPCKYHMTGGVMLCVVTQRWCAPSEHCA